jgi:hypothetical protein
MNSFIYENRSISTLLGSCSDSAVGVKGIWVYNNTLSVTNKYMLIRRRCDLPDGFYALDSEFRLAPAPRIRNFPDIEALEARYLKEPKTMIRSSLLREHRGLAFKTAHDALAHIPKTWQAEPSWVQPVTWDATGFWIDKRENLDGEEVYDRVGEPILTGLPMPLLINPSYINIALTELARYDEVYLIKSGNPDEPVILGLNWGSCVMIMPVRGRYQKANYELG